MGFWDIFEVKDVKENILMLKLGNNNTLHMRSRCIADACLYILLDKYYRYKNKLRYMQRRKNVSNRAELQLEDKKRVIQTDPHILHSR